MTSDIESAIRIAKKHGKIKSSTLQIELNIGFHHAANLMEQMESSGLLIDGQKGLYSLDRTFKCDHNNVKIIYSEMENLTFENYLTCRHQKLIPNK